MLSVFWLFKIIFFTLFGQLKNKVTIKKNEKTVFRFESLDSEKSETRHFDLPHNMYQHF